MDEDLLDALLTKAAHELDEPAAPETKKLRGTAVHTGDTDSSDDEDNRDFENQKYNDFGKSVKHMLGAESKRPLTSLQPSASTWKINAPNKPSQTAKTAQSDVYTDPMFGMRITKPLISQALLKERMQGRDAVPMARVRRYVETLTPKNDWVVAGVIVHKLAKTSQKGNQFAIWTLSDLHGDLKTVSVFLFGSAFKELWKCVVGTVIGVLNPTVFEKKQESRDEACLSVDNFQRVMVFGQSKDLGTCKSKKKNGDQCTAFVNTHSCEFCIFHVKQEYQKCSKRSDLQANFSGSGLTALRNKVLGKNEVFYAGKSYSAIPAQRSRKLLERDDSRLSLLSGKNGCNNVAKVNNVRKKKQAVHVELSANQRMKDLELMKRLGGSRTSDFATSKDCAATISPKFTLEESKSKTESGCIKTAGDKNRAIADEITLAESKCTALNVISKLKKKHKDNNLLKTKVNFNLETRRHDIEKSCKLNNSKHCDGSAATSNSIENLVDNKFSDQNKSEGKSNENTIDNSNEKFSLEDSFMSDIEFDLSDTEIDPLNISMGKNKHSNDVHSSKGTKNEEFGANGNKPQLLCDNVLKNGENDGADRHALKLGCQEGSKTANSGTPNENEHKSDLVSYQLNSIQRKNIKSTCSVENHVDSKASLKNVNSVGGSKENHKNKNHLASNKSLVKDIQLSNTNLSPHLNKTNFKRMEPVNSEKPMLSNLVDINIFQTQAKTLKDKTANFVNHSSIKERIDQSINKIYQESSGESGSKDQIIGTNLKNPSNKKVQPESKSKNNGRGNNVSSKTVQAMSNHVTSENEPTAKSKQSENNDNPQMTLTNVPRLGAGFATSLRDRVIDLNSPIPRRQIDKAKQSAIQWVQQNGPIKKTDPNSTKPCGGKKRSVRPDGPESEAKKQKIQANEFFSDRFKKMMAVTSKHTDLLEQHDDNERDKYFDKLEMKEKMEEKMMSTYKVECKAVRCLQCKYTSFSAAEHCKQQRHPLKVYDAFKRFFKCGDCGNRTVSLNVIPMEGCKNCSSGKWERTTMMRERKVESTHSLSIRGGDQAFTNSVATNSNLNLLVPDD